MLKWIDIPPVWLAGFIVLVWGLGPVVPMQFAAGWSHVLGLICILAGLALIVLAVLVMVQKRTTPIPHMQPDALVTTGVFAVSRNPIYLGDALILVGVILRANAPILLILVPIFAWTITVRFIIAEETRLTTAFGPAFEAYCLKTRRWV